MEQTAINKILFQIVTTKTRQLKNQKNPSFKPLDIALKSTKV